MLRASLLFFAALVAAPLHSQTGGVSVVIDTSEATAVLQALRNPQLKNDQALEIARLPGSQGLIRKALSYDRPASDALFARALVAAAHQESAFEDTSEFHFSAVRNDAAQTSRVLAMLGDPKLHLLADIKARVAMFTPANLSGTVTGHLVLGGAAYGFALGEPGMYLDLEHVQSATLAPAIFKHELFHSVQILAKSRNPPSERITSCLANKPHAKDIELLFKCPLHGRYCQLRW